MVQEKPTSIPDAPTLSKLSKIVRGVVIGFFGLMIVSRVYEENKPVPLEQNVDLCDFHQTPYLFVSILFLLVLWVLHTFFAKKIALKSTWNQVVLFMLFFLGECILFSLWFGYPLLNKIYQSCV